MNMLFSLMCLWCRQWRVLRRRRIMSPQFQRYFGAIGLTLFRRYWLDIRYSPLNSIHSQAGKECLAAELYCHLTLSYAFTAGSSYAEQVLRLALYCQLTLSSVFTAEPRTCLYLQSQSPGFFTAGFLLQRFRESQSCIVNHAFLLFYSQSEKIGHSEASATVLTIPESLKFPCCQQASAAYMK